MNGINPNTGKRISGVARLEASIRDILTTPIGSRVMRRDYGSELYFLLGAPMTAETIMRIYAASAAALDKWEPEFKASQFSVDSVTDGQLSLSVIGSYTPTGETVSLAGILIV